MVASTSIGRTDTACSQAIQPAENPASGPKTKAGNLAVPPAIGYAAPSSACTRASSASITAASTQEIRDGGPARSAPVTAPRGQPEPMIEPRDTNMRPQKPTSRRNCRSEPTAPPDV